MKFGPPQFIKAQMYKESSFDSKAFRYEPNQDQKFFAIDLKRGMIGSIKNSELYKPYFFSSTGNTLVALQKHPRSIYYAKISGEYHSIPDDYETTTGTYSPLLIPQIFARLKSGSSVTYTALSPNANNYIAQTVTSSSYGLLQVLYTTAVSTLSFKTASSGNDPLILNNPDSNVRYASKYLLFLHRKLNGVSSPPTYSDFENKYILNILAAYNGGPGGYKKSDPQTYADLILFYSIDFAPQKSSNIFSN